MVLSRPLLIFVVAMWLFLAITEWKDQFSQKPVANNWAIVDGVVTLIPNLPLGSEEEKEEAMLLDGKQSDID